MHVKTEMDTKAERDAKAEFVELFAEGWAVGATDPERFFAHFGPLLTADAALIQPLSRTFHGPEGLRQLFGPVFEAIPDLRSTVRRWGPTDDGLVIEHTLGGTLSGKRLEWTAVDRFVMRDGLVAERRAYFDSLPLVGAMLRHPLAALKLLPGLFR